ncbi:MAG: sugar phosphate isomerase/epimerase family protein, partial [Phycisphaerae bacterium]
YEPGQDYWRQVELIRSALEGFSRLGQRHGVTACYHTHSGGFYGSSCGALMHLLRGFDPKLVGAYLDTGHLAVEGEDFTMGLAMVGPYLAAVAAKDLRKVPDANTDPPTWSGKHVKLGEGFFNWRQGLEALRAAGFSGPLSIHGEYEQLDQATRARWLAEDVELIKSVLGRLEQRRRA